MNVRRWLVPLLITVAAVPAAEADEPARAPLRQASAASTNAAIDTKGDSASQGNASELHGSYNFLLEVAGVTPGERARREDRTYSAGPQPRRDPRTPGMTIDSAD